MTATGVVRSVAEVTIDGALVSGGVQSRDPSQRSVDLENVLRQIGAAREEGARAVLLVVDCLGGLADTGLAMYTALRAFSADGGSVVAYVHRTAASSAALFVLGADFVVMNPRATIHPHGLVIEGAAGGHDSMLRTGFAAVAGAILSEHTLADEATVRRWTTRNMNTITSGAAEAVGYVDFIGGRATARRLAEKLARGESLASRRRSALLARGSRPELAEILSFTREWRFATGELAPCRLHNHFLAYETAKAKEEVERVRAYARHFDDIRTRARIGKAGPQYLEAIDAILDGVQFRRETNRKTRSRNSIAKHVAKLEAAGETVAPALKELSDEKSWRQMTVEELSGVEEALASVESMARLKGKLLLRKERRDLARTGSELGAHIKANVGATKGPTPGEKSTGEKLRSWARRGDASMKKVEFLCRELDGGKTAGLAHSLIFQPLVDAQNARYDLQDQVYGALLKPFQELSQERKKRYRLKVAFLHSPKFGKMVTLSRRNLLTIALNLGNEGNRERLLQGYGWTQAEVYARLTQLLDAQDVAIVESIWKLVDSLWPQISELHERHAGLAPKRVEATPFSLPLSDGTTANFSGGYYPIVKASELSDVGRNLAELQEAQSLWTANFFAPVVEHGFTQGRGNDMSPLELSLDVVPRHLDKVIHYLTHYEAIRGVDRLLQVPEVREAITEGVGREYLQELRPWLEAIAADGTATDPIAFWSSALRHLRMGASIGMLFGKIPTGVKQLLGLLTSAKEVKRRHMVSGIRLFFTKGWAEVMEQSGEFRHVDKQLDRDARELFTALQGRFSDLGQARAQIIEWGSMPIMLCQKTVNAITWYAAREQALEEGHADPVAYADSVVRMTQTGGGVKDLAAIQRGHEAFKMLTIMFGYRSVLYNLVTERTGKGNWAKTQEVFARTWWLLLAPVLVEQLLLNGIDDDEDEEDVAKRVALEFALLPLSTVPVVGDAAEAGMGGGRMNAAPWLETLGRTIASGVDVVQGDADVRDVKQFVSAAGTVFHLPTPALWNYGDYTRRLIEGELEEPVSDLLFRNPSKWK